MSELLAMCLARSLGMSLRCSRTLWCVREPTRRLLGPRLIRSWWPSLGGRGCAFLQDFQKVYPTFCTPHSSESPKLMWTITNSYTHGQDGAVPPTHRISFEMRPPSRTTFKQGALRAWANGHDYNQNPAITKVPRASRFPDNSCSFTTPRCVAL